MKMEIPGNAKVEVEGNKIKATGKNGTLEYKFNARFLTAKVDGNNLTIDSKLKKTRKVNAAINAVEAHVKNMLNGVEKEFEKNLQFVFAHFPITMEVKGNEVIIKNFLGEKLPRKANIIGKTKVSVAGQNVNIKGSSRDDVGQTAANIVQATKITNKDVRVFQDGAYYV